MNLCIDLLFSDFHPHLKYCGRVCQARHWTGLNEDKGRGKEWSHKKACNKICNKPLRVDLDNIDEKTSITDLGFDPTYGFVLVRKVPKDS